MCLVIAFIRNREAGVKQSQGPAAFVKVVRHKVAWHSVSVPWHQFLGITRKVWSAFLWLFLEAVFG